MKSLNDIYNILEEIKDILIEANTNTVETIDNIDDLPDTKIIKVIPLQDKRFKIKYRK
jgi:hypothetical protein